MVQYDRDLLCQTLRQRLSFGKPFYEIECQHFVGTSHFIKHSDRVSLGQATRVN